MPKKNQKKQSEKKSKKKTGARKAIKKSVKKKAVKKTAKVSTTKNKVGKKSTKNKKASADKRKYVLDSVLVINNAQTIHGQLSTLIAANKDVVIDASSVEMVDTSIFQLLLAFINKLHSKKLKVEWKNPSQEFLSRAATLNLADQLGL